MIPSSRPEATMAGMMGTKTSPSTLIARIKMFCCCAAASLTSALVAASTPLSAMNSS